MSIKFYSEVVKVERKRQRAFHPGTWEQAKGEAQVAYDMVGYRLLPASERFARGTVCRRRRAGV